MTTRGRKPLVRRSRADADVIEAIDASFRESSALATRFVDALEAVYRRIGRAPGTGSPRYAQELDLPGLRVWPCKRFPYLVFYVERDDSIEIWRVLHGSRDLPNRFRDDF